MTRKKIVRHTSEELEAMRRRGESRTDWERVRKMKDKDIVTDEDAPEITDEMMRSAVFVRKTKGQITIRLDRDVIEWFRGKGPRYQTRINAVLKAYMEASRKAS